MVQIINYANAKASLAPKLNILVNINEKCNSFSTKIPVYILLEIYGGSINLSFSLFYMLKFKHRKKKISRIFSFLYHVIFRIFNSY